MNNPPPPGLFFGGWFGDVPLIFLMNENLQVYAILDEIFLAGEIQETSKQVVLARLDQLDKLE